MKIAGTTRLKFSIILKLCVKLKFLTERTQILLAGVVIGG
jgi:hypothetical protein